MGDGIIALERLEREMAEARRKENADALGIDLIDIGFSALANWLRWR